MKHQKNTIISWIKRVTNENVSRRAQTDRQAMKQIVKKHALRKKGIEHQVVTGNVEGKKRQRKKRQAILI